MRLTNLILLFLLLAISCSKKKDDKPVSNLKPWDGRYTVTGTLVDYTEAVIASAGPREYSLSPDASGKAQVLCKDLGLNAHLITHGGSLSYYSRFGLIITIDPQTNKITGLVNSYGQPSANGRSAVLDPSGTNTFDPATKTLKMRYWMDETGVTGHKAAFDETWTYLGPR
ncbi:MAG: hypothetical protein QM781_20070 [Chitinophagaceae bacterium]